MKNYLNIIILSIVILITLYLSSLFYNNKINTIENDFKNYRDLTVSNIQKQKISILEQQKVLKEENLKLVNNLKELENEKYKQYQELQKANSTIKSSIANNERKLYINATCTRTANNSDTKASDTSTTSMVNGETSKATINSRDAAAIISITEKADKYKEQLDSLQEWVNVLILENNK